MPFKSQAQRRKFAALPVEGKISGGWPARFREFADRKTREASAAAIAPLTTIAMIPLQAAGWPDVLRRLGDGHGVERISAVGGRTTASALIDAGVVQDLCLTTTARHGGEANTPFYIGAHPPQRALVVKKETCETDNPITFEHWMLR